MTLPNDKYGRSVTLDASGSTDLYSVFNTDSSLAFTIGFPHGTNLTHVYESIEAMAPEGWSDPPPPMPDPIVVTSDYEFTDPDIRYVQGDTTDNPITITLPTAVGKTDIDYYVEQLNENNSMYVYPQSGEMIEGNEFLTFDGMNMLHVCSDGVGWMIRETSRAN